MPIQIGAGGESAEEEIKQIAGRPTGHRGKPFMPLPRKMSPSGATEIMMRSERMF